MRVGLTPPSGEFCDSLEFAAFRQPPLSPKSLAAVLRREMRCASWEERLANHEAGTQTTRHPLKGDPECELLKRPQRGGKRGKNSFASSDGKPARNRAWTGRAGNTEEHWGRDEHIDKSYTCHNERREDILGTIHNAGTFLSERKGCRGFLTEGGINKTNKRTNRGGKANPRKLEATQLSSRRATRSWRSLVYSHFSHAVEECGEKKSSNHHQVSVKRCFSSTNLPILYCWDSSYACSCAADRSKQVVSKGLTRQDELPDSHISSRARCCSSGSECRTLGEDTRVE